MHALGPIELLFLLAPTVIVPLALRLSGGADAPTRTSSLALRLQPWAAAAVWASFLMRRGPAAAMLAGTWLLVTLLIAWHGWQRLRRAAWHMPEIAISAGCLMLPVGGAWLVLSRLGVTVLGFEEPIPLLTAVHFHYAAFATLILVGLAGRGVGEASAYRLIAGGAIAGPPLLAAGITASPLLEMIAATTLVCALCGLAVLTLVRIVPRLRGWARMLLSLSALSVLAGMACALAYAVGEFTGASIISLGQMSRIHGPLNALGFVLAGLVGWRLAPRNLRAPSL
jgi:hypothetical protein